MRKPAYIKVADRPKKWLPKPPEPPKIKSDNVRLMTMTELAVFVGRDPQRIRECYMEGVLPEPRHIQQFRVKTTRRFTLQEAEAIRAIFANLKHGDFAIKRKRATERKKRMRMYELPE